MPSDPVRDPTAGVGRDESLVSRPRAPAPDATAGASWLALAQPATGPEGAMSLHVSKLRGMDVQTRARLKQFGITYTHQLLEAVGSAAARREFVARSRVDDAVLWRLARRADLARVKGIGAIFADMLEMVGVDCVEALAAEDPGELHRRLARLNAAERLARRAPTPEEVELWVRQARALPVVLEAG